MDTKTIEMIKENMNHDTFLGPLATKNKDAYRVKPEPLFSRNSNLRTLWIL